MKKLSICPLGKVWVNCLKSLKKPSIYPLGKTPSAPSVKMIAEFCPQKHGYGNGDVRIHAMFATRGPFSKCRENLTSPILDAEREQGWHSASNGVYIPERGSV